MNDNESLNLDMKALAYFGKAYLKIPRVILDKLFSDNKNDRLIGKMHLLLYCICNYADGYVTVDGQLMFCKRGECITSQEDLAKKLEVCRRTVKRHLDTLANNSLIEVRRIGDHLNLRVCGYDQFIASTSPFAPETSAVCRTKEEKNINQDNTPRFDLLKYLYQ